MNLPANFSQESEEVKKLILNTLAIKEQEKTKREYIKTIGVMARSGTLSVEDKAGFIAIAPSMATPIGTLRPHKKQWLPLP